MDDTGYHLGRRPRQPSAGAHTVIDASARATEIEALAASTAFAMAVAADRASEEQAHREAEQEARGIEAAEAGRRRRDLAELDDAALGDAADHTAAAVDEQELDDGAGL